MVSAFSLDRLSSFICFIGWLVCCFGWIVVVLIHCFFILISIGIRLPREGRHSVTLLLLWLCEPVTETGLKSVSDM